MPVGNYSLRQSPAADSTPTHRIVVKSVNGHEPGANGSPASRQASAQLQTPQSSPTKTGSPAKSPGRPRRVVPVLTTSTDFGPSAGDSSDEEPESAPDAAAEALKHNAVKRHSRKSKTDAMTAMSGRQPVETKPVANAAPSSADPANHPVRKMTLTAAQTFPPLRFAGPEAYTEGEMAESAIPTSESTPRKPPPRLRPRLFDLEEAPTFYPTAEEFSDPMRYISWVAHPDGGNGKAYGIVKVVPPEGWNPDCVIDEQTFRFRTRVQRLNSLSADARASQNYQEQLQKFHAQQGRKRVSVPIIDGRSVDLYQLKLKVAAAGGFENVCRSRKWTEITRRIGYGEPECSHLSTQVKAAYTRIILPFEEFMSKVMAQARTSTTSVSPTVPQSATMTSQSGSQISDAARAMSVSPATETSASADAKTGSRTPEPTASHVAEFAEAQSPSTAANTRRSSRKRVEAHTPVSAPRGVLQAGASPSTPVSTRRRKQGSPHGDADTKRTTTQGAEEQMCEICLRGEDGPNMLLCDECNRGYHMYCLQPSLTAIPKSEWFCPPCLVGTGHDFGFDDGETHSLYTFWQRAEAFKKAWWSAHPDNVWYPGRDDGDDQGELPTNGLARLVPGTDLVVSEDDVEREFWRLVHTQHEEVEVEYGADVHSTTHGSAMPTQETHPLDPYSRDKWNLNNLPILPGSLLQYIKSDISGMTVPWIYVGMIFSTFCWHNEDHYTYSINYQHWGESKTWYGIPGEDAEKFEDAMRKAAPDLFEMLPDLLFHLTTMMSPEKLKKEGVRVVACDQRANEFVITFPKAYHSGFNHGLNLNEAVNFALPDWINDDLESTRRYQSFRKPAVFAHDQLLITVSQQSQTIETAVWLEAPMQEMVEREIGKRDALREIIPDLAEEVYDEDEPEAKYQCSHCTMFCYLGQVTSPKSEGVACLDHGFEVCNADPPTKWQLRLRFSDDQLRTFLAKVSEKAAVPRNWTQRLKKTLAVSANPPLKSLRSLMHEGEKIAFPLEPLENLRIFVTCANAWVERATVFLTRKVHKRRGEAGATSTGRGRRSIAAVDESSNARASADVTMEEVEPATDRSPQALAALLEELENLHFDTPEIAALNAVYRDYHDFSIRCEAILRQQEFNPGSEYNWKDCESVAALGSSLNVDAPQIKQLNDFVESRKWIREVEEVQGTYLYHHEVVALLERAESYGLEEHELITELQNRRTAGEEWTAKARAALDGTEPVTVQQLEDLSDASADISVVVDVAQDIAALLSKAKDLQKSVQSIHKNLTSTASAVDGDLSVVSVSEDQDVASRMALLPETRRVLRAAKTNNLKLECSEEVEQALAAYDNWRSDYNAILQALSSSSRQLSDADRTKELETLCTRVEETTSPADDQPRATLRQCVCRTNEDLVVPSNTTARCRRCAVKYHLACIKVKPVEVTRADGDWHCPFCPWVGSPALLKARKAVDLSDLANLVYGQGHRRDQLKFLPSEWDTVEEIVAKLMRFETAARTMIRTLGLYRRDQNREFLSHWLRRAIASPVDVYIVADVHVAKVLLTVTDKEKVKVLDMIDAHLSKMGAEPMEYVDPQQCEDWEREAKAKAEREQAGRSGRERKSAERRPGTEQEREQGETYRDRVAGEERKRKAKRGKRAKLVFREEIGIGAYRGNQPIYCLCHEVESGRMIACDKCMLWFHTRCVRLEDPPNLGDEPWICPMCCIKAERKYPQAEVRVKEMGVTDPDSWLDIRATLRSLKDPVSKTQCWNSREDRRIVLHLEKFQPAIHAEEVQVTNPKRQKTEGESPAKARGTPMDETAISAQAGQPHSAVPPIPSEAARFYKTPSKPESSRAVAEPKSAAKSISETPPVPDPPRISYRDRHERATDPRRHHADGMDNLYRRGVTDAMLTCYYIGWNGKTLFHSLRDAYGTVVEVPIGEKVAYNAEDPTGSRMLRAAIERYNEQWKERKEHKASRAEHDEAPRSHHRHADPLYEHRHRSSLYGETANVASSSGYRRVSDSERERERKREPWEYELESRKPAPVARTRSPTPRTSGAPHEAYARDSERSRPAAAPVRSEHPPHREYDDEPRLYRHTSSSIDRPSASPHPAPRSAYPAAEPALDPALNSTHSNTASPAPALRPHRDVSTPPPEPSPQKPARSDADVETARQMARRMRPTASDAEIDEMVRAFLST